jgi:hypothetical protein
MDQLVVGWLERPQLKIGLDNLGTQQPCIAIYSRLLPGVTNVTDRASYFGFYPWFLRAFEQRFPDATDIDFRTALRRADCLLTLVAERHDIASGGNDAALHGAACAGRQKLRPAAVALSDGGALNINEYADRTEGNPKRYFKNPLGGLGQYYLGPLRDEYLVLVGNTRSGVRYTHEHGEPLAISFADGLDEGRFFATLAQETIDANALDALVDFCPCSIHAGRRSQAQQHLITLLLGDRSAGGVARATTFHLLMEFLEIADGAPSTDAVKDFLGSCYAGAIGADEWVVAGALEQSRSNWALYARNEMMSLAWYTFFKLALDELNGQPKPFQDVRRFADWLLPRPSFADVGLQDFDDLLADDTASAPELLDLLNSDHELALWRRITDVRPPPIDAACDMLVRLVTRWGQEAHCYAPMSLPKGALASYPLTLDSLNRLAAQRWRGLSAQAWLKSLLIEVLSAHQRVAIRKLGESGEDTLMFRISEAGMTVQRKLDGVVETQPRVRQALQVLLDLGLTTSHAGTLPILTDLGRQTLAGLRS